MSARSNAANSALAGGGGVDVCHPSRAAEGPEWLRECLALQGRHATWSGPDHLHGYGWKERAVIHAGQSGVDAQVHDKDEHALSAADIGPRLGLAVEDGLPSLAFPPAISTGTPRRFPPDLAGSIAASAPS